MLHELDRVQSANILIQHPEGTSAQLGGTAARTTMSSGVGSGAVAPSQGADASLQVRPSQSRQSFDTGNNDGEEEAVPWGPAHPDFPHLNPHVPITCPLHQSTRIIRIPRSFEAVGDLAPTFDDTYPREVLQPHISQAEFYQLIENLNEQLIDAFSPCKPWNILDSILGVMSLWIWEDLGMTQVKSRLRAIEVYIEDWNKKTGYKGRCRILPLRRTGYMSIDIEIPDPEIKAEVTERMAGPASAVAAG